MKQRPVRKLLALVLSLLLVFAFTPVAFAAEGDVAQIGENTYPTLQAAVEAAKSGDEIMLIADAEANGVGIEKQLILNLNGYTLSAASTTATPPNAILVIKGAGDLTITGTGTITNGVSLANYHALLVGEGGKLNIESGVTVSVTPNNCQNTQCCVLIRDEGSTLTTSGALTNAGYFAISGNNTYAGATTVNITGGSVRSTFEGMGAIYQPQDGTINISGGLIEAGDCIVLRKGTLNVTGGTLNATGPIDEAHYNKGGADTSGSAIYVEVNPPYSEGNDVKVSITGGTITSRNSSAVYVATQEVITAFPVDIGEDVELISGTNATTDIRTDSNAKAQSKISITDGTFSKPVDKDFLSADTVSIKSGDNYYVGEAANEKIASATAGETIEVTNGTTITGVPGGVIVTNSTGEDITVNNEKVAAGDNITIESKPEPQPEPSNPSSSFTEPEYYPDYDEDVDYLPPVEDEEGEEKAPLYMVTCRTLNVRMGPGTSYAKLGTLSRGTLISGEYENGWVKFTYNGQTAYSSADYLMQVDGDLSGLHVTCRTLNVRAGAGTNFDILGTLSRGTEISVRDVLPGWYEIDFLGGIGYVSSAYIG